MPLGEGEGLCVSLYVEGGEVPRKQASELRSHLCASVKSSSHSTDGLLYQPLSLFSASSLQLRAGRICSMTPILAASQAVNRRVWMPTALMLPLGALSFMHVESGRR